MLKEQVLKLNYELEMAIESLNCGGCGIFAYVMYNRLRELGYAPHIMVFDDCSSLDVKKYNITRCLSNNAFVPGELSSQHFAIMCDGLIFDGYECHTDIKDFDYRFIGEYCLSELRLALDKGTWNDTYDIEQTPLLIEIIYKHIVKI